MPMGRQRQESAILSYTFVRVLMLSLVTRLTRARGVPLQTSLTTRPSSAFLFASSLHLSSRQLEDGPKQSSRHFCAPLPRNRLDRFSTTVHFLSTSSSSDPSSLLEGLNEAQVKAVTQPLSSITRVVAGPGAGKTRVLTSRIGYLLEHDPVHSILAVTFTKKASGEMQNRLERLLDTTNEGPQTIAGNIVVGGSATSPLDRVTLGTFHSVCAKILRWNGRLLETLPSVVRDTLGRTNVTRLDGNFAIVDQSEQLRLLRQCANELELRMEEIKPQTILNAMGTIKEKLALGEDPMKPPDKSPPSKAIREGMKYFSLYREKIVAQNALDFDDLILMTRELLTEHEDVRNYLRRRWHHVLVDEFQDTSRVQLDLVKLLSDSSLLVVGDADQSIYSWRGAHVESMSDFCHEFDHRMNGVETVYLMENYRSTTNIVNAAQKVISGSAFASKQDTLRQKMKPMRGSGPTPRILACADGKAEAGFVVKTVQEMIASGEYSPDSTIAFIYRTNAQSRDLEEACVKANLPYVIRGASGSFYKRAEIKDSLCFLRLLSNGRDDASFVRVSKTPSRGIGDATLDEFRQYSAAVEAFYGENLPDQTVPTPFDVLLSLADEKDMPPDIPSPKEFISTRGMNRFVPFSKQMLKIKQAAYTQNVADLLSTIIDNLDLKDHFDSISKSKAEFADRWSNVLELRRAAERYSGDGASLKHATNTTDQPENFVESPLGNFLDDVALVTDVADESTDSKGAERRLIVSLMTIHASKGMEFDSVFLVGNEDGTLPTKLAIMEGTGSVPLEEEKRLCYVAMTRAKTNLVMTWRKEVSVFSGNSIKSIDAKRSRFLDVLVGKRKQTDSSQSKGERTARLPREQRSTARTTTLPLPSLGPKKNLRPIVKSSSPGAAKLRNGARRGVSSTASSPAPRREPRPAESSRGAHAQAMDRGTGRADGRRRTGDSHPQSNTRNPSQRRRSVDNESPETMDSTWFYPIGSTVLHKQLGAGQVLPPPPSKNGELLVRVQFQNGDKHDFPADGMDLHLNFS